MEDNIKDKLKRQAGWQRKRAQLSWGEKLRLSVVMWKSLAAIKKAKDAGPSPGGD